MSNDHAATIESPATAERRPLHRVGSLTSLDTDLEHPHSIGQRITARRLELGMTQEQVAAQIVIVQKSDSRKSSVGRKIGDSRKLSRSAYCMYERDSVKPVLAILEQVAKALRTSPAWITFGEGPKDPVVQLSYDPATDEFQPQQHWALDQDWLREQFAAKPSEVALVAVTSFTPSLKPGEIAVIRREAEPGSSGGEYAFGLGDDLRIAYVTRPQRAGKYRVYDSDRKNFEEFEPADVNVLGKVVGKFGSN